LGVLLPQEVIDFNLPYCPYVEMDDDIVVDDVLLLHAADTIEVLAEQLAPQHNTFRLTYFSDLSFLLASLAFGVGEAVQLKFSFTRDIVATGNRAKVAEVVEQVPDLLAEFA
jgi:hypothetical protein